MIEKKHQTLFLYKFLLFVMVFLAGCSSYQSDIATSTQTAIAITDIPYMTATLTKTASPSPTLSPTETSTPTPTALPTQSSTATLIPPLYSTLREGTYIVYSAAYFRNDEFHYQLEVLSLDGNYQGYLLEKDSEQGDISLGGRYLAYMELLSPLKLDRLKLYVFDFESNEFVQIPDLVGACYRANWASDGKQLLLTCETETSIDVFAFSLQDGLGHRLTDCEERDALSCVYPAWSPDGKWIAYYKDSVRSGVSEIQGLYFLDGSCVDESESCESTDIGPFDVFGPYTWSPDGLYLAGLEHSTQTSFIRIFSIQDDTISHFRDIEAEDYVDSISWSPDGQWIAYSSGSKIYLVSPDGEKTIYLHEANGANVIGWITIPPTEE